MGSRSRSVKKRSARIAGSFSQWWFALPAALGLLLYLNTLGHQWCLDDYSVIVDNWVTRQGWEGIPIHLSHHYRYGYWAGDGDLYRPLSLVMFAAEWALFGNNPFPGHLVNVLLYAAVCLLFGLAIYRWSRGPVFSMLAALLFAVHPLHSEVVANIKSRDELLAMFFLLLTWLAWQRLQHHRPRLLWLILSMIAFSLALLAKESAITFLPLLPLSLYAFRQKPKRADYLWSLPLLLPAGLFLLGRRLVLGNVRGLDQVSILDNVLSGAGDAPTALASALRHIGEYLGMLVWPWPLVSDKGWNQIPLSDFGSPGVWLSLLAMLAGLGAIGYFWSRQRCLVFGLLWFVATFSLAANLLFLIGTSYGERLLFLPSAGFAIAVAALLRWRDTGSHPAWPGWLRRPLGLAFGTVLLAFALLTVFRNPAWFDSYTLYATDIRRSPESVKLRYHYALETGKKATDLPDGPDRQARLGEALADLERVVTRHPVYWEAFATAGLYAYRLGQQDRAMDLYTSATRLNPGAAIAWSNMGIIHSERGRPDLAREVYQKAVQADPRFADAWMNLGAVQAQMGEFRAALEAFEEALRYDPENPRLLFMLGSVHKDLGQPDQGEPYLEKARRLQSGR
jgi:protein O-mannosyl-transferase